MAYYDGRQYSSRPSAGYNPDYYYPPSRHQTDVVRHHRDGSVESFEAVHRDYPPADYGYEYGYGIPPQGKPTRASTVHESVRRSHSVNPRDPYDDGSDYYRHSHRRSRRHDDRHDRGRYSRSPSDSRSPPPRRRKSISEQALGALGLGSLASSGSRHRERGRSQARDRKSYSYSPSPTRSRSRHRREKSEQRIAQAMRAALTAGAIEAFRVRKDPGEWTGAKGKRILTAAIAAGGTDGLVDRDPKKHSKRHVVESTLAGLAANHFLNGSRSRSRSRGRHHGRSQSNSGVKNLAATGALAAIGKEAYDRFRSRSRPRDRSRGRSLSQDSYEDRRPRPRSKSVSDYIHKGMEALGLSEKDHRRDSRDSRDRDGRRSSRRDDYPDDYSDYEYRRHRSPRRSRHSRDVSRPIVHADEAGYSRTRAPDEPRSNSNSTEDCDSDLGSSTDEEKRQKKLTRKTLVKTGLATVATIHAAHELYENMEKHKKRAEQLREGEITPEEARRRRLKANLGDVASVGIAAWGIKGAAEEWKHAAELRKERHKLREECEQKRERRHQRAQSHTGYDHHQSRTMYPDEIEEHHPSEYGSTPSLRSRSAGRSGRVPMAQYA
ncbi:hypothetical protein ASPACDRAFT_118652 [Aspergillus aculeatus ATCC 16872]|uniref:DUF3824 domain-containing protein n=1 Tax=Aspergillus aculeatus (strain ATCC 16872 / CBS 172.66 / WB 5094) TaxID=690307 RepID=A0A1L9WW58_ASPA1|nr:uncharacterized protein ASPACDRAFT_118652 [Aspergillus aculeatus ATCC 16872]OJK00409.1 hypothetical protein ASPACDRAFT_118652 [Aspergillus aculeatus ATCC 16872]